MEALPLPHVKEPGQKGILHCNFSVTDLPTDIPKFCLDCFAVWCKLVNNNISTEKQIVSEILWNNHYLRISYNTVYSEKLISKGILRIGDILSAQTKLQPWLFFENKGLVLNEYFLLLGIYNAIPASWKNILKSAETAFTQQTTDTLDLISLFIYKNYIFFINDQY